MFKFIPSIDRYIFRLVVVPMLGVFAIAASLLILDKMLRLFDFVAVEGGPVGVVFKMLAALIPEYASLAIPLGLLLGILLAFRKLATSSELDVLRAVGLGYGRLLRVPFIITALLMGLNVALVFYIQPVSRYYYEQLEYELRSGALGASIKVGEFTTLADRMALRIEQSEDEGRRLKGIFARVANDKGQVLSISAREGAFLATTDDPNTIILRLTEGTIVQESRNQTPRVLTFTRHDLPIDLPTIERFRARGDAEREYILPELLRIGWSNRESDSKRDASQASFNFRLVEVVMMALMPLLAVALGIPPKRSTSALGVFLSIVMVVAYHKVNQYGEDIAALGGIRSDLGVVGPVPAVRGADRVDVLARGAYPRGPGDRRARNMVRQADQAAGQAAPAATAADDRPCEERLTGAGMQLDFFPSRTLTLYLAKLFIVRIVAMLAMLVLVLMMLDLLSNSGKILAVEGNGQGELLTYVSLRIPQLVSRFLPYSVLLATLITLVTLNQNSEVIAMKAAGLSAHQVLAPLLLTAALVALASFAFNERVVTRATETLEAWQAVEFGPIPTESGVRTNVYLSDGGNVLTAAYLGGSGGAITMRDVTWYRRNADGMIVEQVDAERARYANPGWRLENVTRFGVQNAVVDRADSMIVGEGLTPGQIDLVKVDADAVPFLELHRSIEAFDAAGRRTSELRAKWWHKISGPLSAFLMPLLGAVAAFGLARSGQLFVRAIIGMALGFTYFVVDNAALAMGSFGGYPPLLAAWAPFLLFLLIGETVLVRTEE